MAFSMEKGNLYQAENIHDAENTYKEKRDRVLDNIIDEGIATQNPEMRESCRLKLMDKIKEGFIDREYLSKYAWSEDRVLITGEIVDFLIPPIEPTEKEAKAEPNIKLIKEVILPTKNGNGPEAGNGAGMAEKRLIPRFDLMVNFLKENKISEDNYFCYSGKNKEGMMRRESYTMFVIPDLKKMVLTCDEEGNATYIIHNAPTKDEFGKLKRDEEVAESERLPSFYYNMSKDDLRILATELGIVSTVNWEEEKWLEKVEDELTKEVSFDFTLKEIKKFLELEKLQKNVERGTFEPAPSGWMTNRGLCVFLKTGYFIVKDAADNYLKTHNDWSKLFLDSTGNVRLHYSPELVEKIIKELTKYKPAPSGWLTNNGLTSQIGTSSTITVKAIANKYIETHKDWFKQFKDIGGRVEWHYSPELIEVIKKEFTKYGPAPSGWLTKEGLIKLVKKKHKIQIIANKYIETHKDWFKEFKDVGGRVRWHYSPELIEKIKQDLLGSKANGK